MVLGGLVYIRTGAELNLSMKPCREGGRASEQQACGHGGRPKAVRRGPVTHRSGLDRSRSSVYHHRVQPRFGSHAVPVHVRTARSWRGDLTSGPVRHRRSTGRSFGRAAVRTLRPESCDRDRDSSVRVSVVAGSSPWPVGSRQPPSSGGVMPRRGLSVSFSRWEGGRPGRWCGPLSRPRLLGSYSLSLTAACLP